MSAAKGYYSLIQFIPDPSRLEAVNIGVLLFCPEKRFIGVNTSRTNRRAKKLLDGKEIDLASLNAAKNAIERRIEVDRESFKSLKDLQQFVDTRANILKLTEPRPIKVSVPEQDLMNLFNELVGGVARKQPKQEYEKQLDTLFIALEQQGRAQRDCDVKVPNLGLRIHAPYAFKNGALNLVKTQRFSLQEDIALKSTSRLALEGDVLHKHGADEYGKTKLIVVTAFDNSLVAGDLENRVRKFLEEYHVKPVRATELPEFVLQVTQEAHS